MEQYSKDFFSRKRIAIERESEFLLLSFKYEFLNTNWKNAFKKN